MKRALFVLLIVAAIGAGGGAYYIRRGGPEVGVTTAPIARGDIVDTVGATGTLAGRERPCRSAARSRATSRGLAPTSTRS